MIGGAAAILGTTALFGLMWPAQPVALYQWPDEQATEESQEEHGAQDAVEFPALSIFWPRFAEVEYSLNANVHNDREE